MIPSILLGAVAGARSMTPLAAVSLAAWKGALPEDNGAPALLGHPLVAAGTTALALGELAGDKLPSAPDRIVLVGLIARIASAGIAGAALAPRSRRYSGAALAAAAAFAASFPTFAARVGSMRRFGQTSTGLVEDVLVVASAYAIVRNARAAA